MVWGQRQDKNEILLHSDEYFPHVRYENKKKCIEGILYEENEHYQKRALWEFLKFQGRKTWKEHENHPIWEKKILQKKCLFSVFQLPTYQSSITHEKHQSWRNRTSLLKKRVFWGFFFSLCHLLFLCTKTSKCIQISVYGITGHYQKRVIWMFFEYIRHQNAKSNGNLSIWENKTTWSKTCILSVFKLLRYEVANVYAKHLIWEKKTVLIKTFILSVFQFT